MVHHYMKAVFSGIIIALIATGFNLLAGLLIKWFNGNPVDQLVSIKHLYLFLITLLLSAGYLSIRQPE